MPPGVNDIRIQYVLDVVDKGSKHLLASERQVQKSLVQTSREFARQDSAAKRSGVVATQAARQKATAQATATRSARVATTGLVQLTRAERGAAAEATRAAAATTKAAAANDRLAASARRAEAASARAARRRPGVIASTGTAAASARSNAGFAAGIAGAIGINETIKFDKALRNVNSIAGLTEKQLQAVGKAIRELATDTAQGPTVLAEGLYDLVSSGFDAKQALVILRSSAKGATAGLTDAATSTAAVAAVLNAYHRPASDAANITDTLFQTVNKGVISFEQLASTIGDVLPFASSLSIGLDEVGASASTLTKAGISPEETMTRIKNVMVAMLKPGDALAVAYKKLGVGSGEALIKQRGFQGSLEAIVGTTDGTKAAVANLFPNIRALGGALALTGKNTKGAEADLKSFGNVSGATNKALAEQSKSTAYQWQQAKANAQSLAITVGNNLLPPLNDTLKTFTGLPGPVKIATAALVGTALVVGPINKLRKNVVELGQSIGSVARRAAKSNIASSLANSASGAGSKVKKALSGVGGIVSRLMGRAGTQGGTALASNAAAGAGTQIGASMGAQGGKFRKAGLATGRLIGKGIVGGILLAIPLLVWEFKDAINKIAKQFSDTTIGKIVTAPGDLGGIIGHGIGSVLGTNKKRRGGIVERRFNTGGFVPIVASGGEMHVDGGRATMIGGPSDRDATPMLARAGSAILTHDGQARMAMGASLAEAVATQAPHFARGGVVPGRYSATAYGPPWGGIQGTGVTRTGVNLKGSPRIYGIATDPRLIPLGSKVFAYPNPFGFTGRFSAFDTGGAIKGRRVDFYDWRGRQHQQAWGRRSTTISRARIAPRQEGEDTYRAPGGRGAETTVSILGRDRRRAGLIGDAFSQGLQAGQEGLTRARIGREGNPVLAAIREALAGAGTQPDKGGPAARFKSETVAFGNFPAGSRIARMGSKAATIDARHYQYAWGGGHGRIGVPTVGTRTSRGGQRGLGYDCSGGVSAVLGAGGLLRSPLTSGALMGWGKPGNGKRLAVHADARHVIMRLGKRFWGTGEANPNGGAGWLPRNTMAGRGVVRTWPGMRAGGIVGGGTRIASAGTALSGGLSRVVAIIGGSLEALDTVIGRSVEGKILALRDSIAKRVEKGGPAKVIQRLQSVLDLIDFELGRRVGRILDVVEQRSAGIERRSGFADRTNRRLGIDADSVEGIGRSRSLQAQETADRRSNVTSLQGALRRAQNARQPAVVKDLTQQLADARDALDESVTRQMELWRDGVRAAAQEGVNAAQFGLSMAQTGAAGLEAQQRLSRTQDTPGGLQQRAGFAQGVIIPALQAAQQAAARAAEILASTGDVNGWRQAVQDAASAAVDLANAQADAADLMRQATAQAAQERVDAATHGRTLKDLGLQRLELEQRLIGTFGSTGGGQGRADFIRSQILPAIQVELQALMLQAQAAQSTGDAALANQIAEAIAAKQNEVLQAQLDAQETIAANTESLKEFGGSTAFSYRDQLTTDLDVIRARVGA